MKNLIRTFCFLFSISCFTACEKTEESPLPDPTDLTLEQAATQISLPAQEFAFELFRKVNKDKASENVLLSPYSISSALNLAYNGAGGETQQEMASVLRQSDLNLANINRGYQLIRQHLLTEQATIDLKIANAAFYDPDKINPKTTFLDQLKQYYDAATTTHDFTKAETVEHINDWVKSNTGDKIEKIIDNIGSEEALFLINAIYFKGDWTKPFPERRTQEASFKIENDQIASVQMMSQDGDQAFYQGADFEAVDLGFGEDSGYTMSLILPTEGTAIQDFIENFGAGDLQKLYQEQLATSRVIVHLPRFELDFKIDLKDALKALGMEKAFNMGGADFSELATNSGNIFLTRVNHKTVLKVDEKGAEGAAVTSVGVGVNSIPPMITFDRPFLVVLRETTTNSILFLGKVMKP